VDLEKLASRPEVLDVLALGRALLNPLDRVAWLGVLRAPWCGLTLESLHLLASADDREVLARPVPELLTERLHLLGEEDRKSAQRVLEALYTMPSLRASQPTASLGTWLQQVWLRLGGGACVDAAARANLDLLWTCLDRLPGGEQDLLGRSLNAALDKLTAQPDPAASSECGVQLMTIHKSKGLEFEVVIVPELQAGAGRSNRKMLSWLERGLAQPDDWGEITEFLIAPFQSKGEDRGKAKQWVDRVYRERESQETRRILYVAATRAREELHFFARPACKAESSGDLSLVYPVNSLLATAWPALEDEVRTRFEDWKAVRTAAPARDEQVIESLAASGQSNLLVMPPPPTPTMIRRLPPDYRSPQIGTLIPPTTNLASAEMPGVPSFPRPFAEKAEDNDPSTLYFRHAGGLPSRMFGVAVHALLQDLSCLRTRLDWEPARAALQRLQPRIAARVRAAGIDQTQSAAIAAKAFDQALDASRDPIGQWILSPRVDAASEVSWAGVISGTLRTIRVDRAFRAGPEPLSEGQEFWWIIDYKTAHAESAYPAASLPELRRIFAPQVEAYAQVLHNLHGDGVQVRTGLYYPRILLFDWWEP
jgi:ATP-dependent exoDNAse (exonuclease V) beta subunit